MEKYVTFNVPTKKKYDDGKTVTHKLRFIDSFRFMQASLPEHVNNLSGIFNSIESEKCVEREKIDSECRLVRLKIDKLIYRCRECKKNLKKWERPIEGLTRKFPSIYQFCNGDLN